jgi:hypothetical protein
MRRIGALTALVALVVPAAASGGSSSYGVALRSAIVNSDHSITIMWSLESADVFNAWLAIDGTTVSGLRGRATYFRTAPVSAGGHTITIQANTFFETYSPQGQDCQVSGGHWLCSMTWRSSTSVTVPTATKCPASRTVGLQLKVAMARIRDAGCSLETVKHVRSKRPAGTVLNQVQKGMAISLVVSNGRK